MSILFEQYPLLVLINNLISYVLKRIRATSHQVVKKHIIM